VKPSPAGCFTAAMARTQELLRGPDGRRRWRGYAFLSVMSGSVAVGAQPPPLGLLQPLWANREIRNTLLGDARVVVGFIVLAAVLIGFGVVARAFTLTFMEGLMTGAPTAGRSRSHFRAGAAHFAWSSALSIPLYLILFAAEWLVTHQSMAGYERILADPSAGEAELMGLLAGGMLGFLAVLLPWVIVTLPLMVWMYELTPAVMLRDRSGPVVASRVALGEISALGAPLYGFLRLTLQLVGGMLSGIALAPAIVVAGVLGSPFLLAAWFVPPALGGWSTGAGGAIGVASLLLAVVILYCVLCALLVPLTTTVLSVPLAAVRVLPTSAPGERTL